MVRVRVRVRVRVAVVCLPTYNVRTCESSATARDRGGIHGMALKNASPELQADREVMLAAVQLYVGWALDRVLRFAPPELRADREVVLAAVQQDGRALEHAPPELRADREVVLAAVQQDGRALEFASPELRADREVVLAAEALGRPILVRGERGPRCAFGLSSA
jgi:hypothetical protein